MNSKRAFFVYLLLLSALLTAVLAPPARAQLAPEITGVQPSTVSNNVSVELVVTGNNFVDGASVILQNYGGLDTTFVSITVLRADLPAGIAPGVYDVTVVNPDSTSATLPDALTVIVPTETPEPTATVAPEASTTPSTRPLIIIQSYGTNVDKITPGKEFKLSIKLKNIGELSATNVVAVFTPGDFIPQESGGVLATREISAGENKRFDQPLTASSELAGKTQATLVMTVSYTDDYGAAYSQSFNVSLPVTTPFYGPAPTSTPTPTPTAAALQRPQLVITGYRTDQMILQPGTRFSLSIQTQNLGNVTARRVSMILGGGSTSGGNVDGTPDVGGVSGGSGDFGTFAPVASSNVQYIGDMEASAVYEARASLIVNASANPGAYPMKISFSYVDPKGNIFNDDQVITLLVYTLPQVDINFYRQPDGFFAGQPGLLPLQVVNLGRKTAILGNMHVTAEGAQLTNNVILIGALDIGGYYTLDATLIPDQPGPLDLLVTIDYTDDFNQSQVVTRTITVDVQEMIIEEPIPGEGGTEGEPFPPVVEPETFWQKAWRFIRGLLGLDSGVQQPSQGEFPPGEVPPEGVPSEGVPPVEEQPLPAPVKG